MLTPKCPTVLGFEDADTLNCMSDLAFVCHKRGQYEEAIWMFRTVLSACEKILPEEHYYTLNTRHKLAMALDQWAQELQPRTTSNRQDVMANYREAEQLYRSVFASRENAFGPEASKTLDTMDNIVIVLYRQDKTEEAESISRDVVRLRSELEGAEPQNAMSSVENLGYYLQARKSIQKLSRFGNR